MINLCLTFWRTVRLFSKVADPWGFWFCYIPINTCYCAGLILGILVSTHVEHLLCSLIASLKKCLLKFLTHFLIGLSFYCWVVRCLYIFWTVDPYQIYDVQIFISSCGLSFHFLDSIVYSTKVLNSDVVQFIWFFYSCLYFWSYSGNHCLTQGHESYLCVFF